MLRRKARTFAVTSPPPDMVDIDHVRTAAFSVAVFGLERGFDLDAHKPITKIHHHVIREPLIREKCSITCEHQIGTNQMFRRFPDFEGVGGQDATERALREGRGGNHFGSSMLPGCGILVSVGSRSSYGAGCSGIPTIRAIRISLRD